jgi:hypothetical protein
MVGFKGDEDLATWCLSRRYVPSLQNADGKEQSFNHTCITPMEPKPSSTSKNGEQSPEKSSLVRIPSFLY